MERPKPRDTLELLAQRAWWRNASGEWLAIADMTPEHRLNAAAMLVRKAAAYQRAALMAEINFMRAFSPPDDVEFDTFGQPVDWMQRQHLYRALVADLPTSPRKLAKLAARASHWSTCPMRLRKRDRHPDAACTCKTPDEQAAVAAGTENA
jgi:hypothetical protein